VAKKKTYRVVVSWLVKEEIEVEAVNEDKAIEIAMSGPMDKDNLDFEQGEVEEVEEV